MKGCHKCPYNGKGSSACLSCDMQQETYDYGYGKYILETYTPVQPDTSGSEKATSLADDVEDALRKIMYTIFDLTPNELLLLQAIFKGKSLAEYAADMEKLAEKNIKFSRHRAFQTRKAIIRKLGPRFALALVTKRQKRPLKTD